MTTKRFRTPAGSMAYTDVGSGTPLVFLHGNPTSAHLYRHLVRALAPDFRCIAPDYLGFGRSEAPSSFSYRPAAHASLVEALLVKLNLSNLTLVLHDWGGPIGLSYALRHPETVRRLILINTWAWPLAHRPLLQLFSWLTGTPIGRIAVEHFNAFVRVAMPLTLGRVPSPTPPWIRAYATALDSPERRRACWKFACSLRAEADWLRSLWTRRSRLGERPTLLCWGMADPAFGSPATLHRWQSLFPDATTHRFPESGHYVPEEMGPELAPFVTDFLQSTAV